MRDQIIVANSRKILAETKVHTQENLTIELGARPYAKLIMAWDIISLPYIKPRYQVSKNNAESGLRERAKILGHTVTLDPMESKLLDAMAEAVGIPNTYRQLTHEKKASKERLP